MKFVSEDENDTGVVDMNECKSGSKWLLWWT